MSSDSVVANVTQQSRQRVS